MLTDLLCASMWRDNSVARHAYLNKRGGCAMTVMFSTFINAMLQITCSVIAQLIVKYYSKKYDL